MYLFSVIIMGLNKLVYGETKQENDDNFDNNKEEIIDRFKINEEEFNKEINRLKSTWRNISAVACFVKKAELLGDKKILEYVKLLNTDPEQINFWEFAEDLNKWEWFRDDIKEGLRSNLVDSISSDVIYEEYFSSLREMPFMAEVLNIKDYDWKRELLTEVLQKQKAINEKYYNEKGLDELSDILGEESVDYVFKDKDLSMLAECWDQLQAPLKLYLADKIVQNLSNKFWINSPHVVNINFWEQDFTMWSKWIINLNLNANMFRQFRDFIVVLLHEFTHCLQDNYKTPWWEDGIREAKKYYFNWITWDDRLNNLWKEVHDSSLLDKEAFYVQAKIKERVLKINNKAI